MSADLLLFDQGLGDADDELRRQFGAVRQFDPEQREMAQGVLKALFLKHQYMRFFVKPISGNAGTKAASPPVKPAGSGRKATKARQRGSAVPCTSTTQTG